MPSRRDFVKLGGATLLTGLAGCQTAPSAETPTAAETTPIAAETTPTSSENTPTPEPETQSDPESVYTQVYRETIDSVVLVRTNQGQGTGFMFDESSVVTNAHVVGQADGANIRFTEGRWDTGTIVGTDPHSDLAVLSVGDVPAAATPLPFSKSEATVGQEVVAIGNPYNLNGTITTGIVSGVDRSIPAPTGFRIPDAIQTDAPVNPGNSGGPLMSLDGRVVAVINSGGGDNIAFGISAALTQRVVPELIASGEYEHSYLGVGLRDVTPSVAQANGLDEPRGLLIVEVVPGGPADGILQPSTDLVIQDQRRVPVGGDVVLAIEGTQIMTSEDLNSYLALQTQPGDTVEVTVLRDETKRTVDVELGTRPTRT